MQEKGCELSWWEIMQEKSVSSVDGKLCKKKDVS